MTAQHKRFFVWIGICLLIGVAVALTLRPQPVRVGIVEVYPEPMQVMLNAEGETRVHDVFVLSAPVAGRMLRIEGHVGDPVVANKSVLVRLEPGDPTFLDVRSEAQANAAIKAAESAQALARAEVDRATAELEFAQSDHDRIKDLYEQGTVSRRELDAAERAFKTSRAALATTRAGLDVRTFELEQAKARLLSPATASRAEDCACIDLTSPVSGRILRIYNPSERTLASGDAILDIGDAHDLEIVADYLSSDAVRIEPGQPVSIDNWGGAQSLAGVVRHVEPLGFTKVSALGIEEQRVNVLVDITSPAQEWERLGHGYQVETNVIIWQQEDALTVPLTALFRDGEQWAVFVVEDGTARKAAVNIGHRNGVVAEVTAGLDSGTLVIVHPNDDVRDGVRVQHRSAG